MDFVKSHCRNPPTALGATANPPKSDDKYAQKSVQLVRGSAFRSDFLQNPYFSYSLALVHLFSSWIAWAEID